MILVGPAIVLAGEANTPASSRIYSDREALVALERAGRAFRDGEMIDGVRQLRRLFDHPADSFVTTAGGTRGIRAAAEELLEEQLPSVRQFVRTTGEAEASAALASALASGDAVELGIVASRFPETEAAFKATNRLASIAFDRGDHASAARLWEGLARDQSHAQRLTPAISAKFLVALRRSGRDGRASELALQLSGKPLNLGGRPSTVGALLRSLPAAEMPPGSVAGQDSTAAGLSAPVFPPAWEQARDPALATLVELWAGCRRNEARPLASAASAVFADGALIVRGVSDLVALDPVAGQVHWTAPLGEPASPSLTNDLHGLTWFEERYAGSGVYGGITADGERVYTVLRSPEPSPPAVRTASHSPPNVDRSPEREHSNRVVAWPLGAQSGGDRRPAWEIGGPSRDGVPLGGRYFFGPPVPAGGCLLAVAEHRQCLNLVAIDPETGAPLWEQPLGFVPRPVGTDADRSAIACTPIVAGGIAVCGTNAGFVAAVDVLKSRLLWAFDYASQEPVPTGGTYRRPDCNAYYGDPSINCPVVIRGEAVVLMPHDSRFVHCLDLRTGGVRWSAPREDGLFVGCVTDSLALIVGRSFCRALTLVSGSPAWSARLGSPTGTGVASGSMYLLPLESGTVACVDLMTGRRVGYDVPRDPTSFGPLADGTPDTDYADRWRPGHLYTDGRVLFSVGPTGVACLETAARWLRTAPADEDPIALARAELAAGRLESARPRLDAAEKDRSRRDEALHLLRELHYLRLAEGRSEEPADALAELDRLSRTPPDRAKFLLYAAENDVLRNDRSSLAARADEFAGLALKRPVASPRDAAHFVTAESWVPAMLGRYGDASASVAESDDAFAGESSEELRRRLLRAAEGAGANAVRRELARRALGDGNIQRAELLLLQNLAAGDDSASRRELKALHVRFGVAGETETGPERPVDSVRISGRLWAPADDAVCQVFGRQRRGFPLRGNEALRVIDRGDSRESRLAILNLAGGVRIGEIALDSRLRWPMPSGQSELGHFVPVAGSGRLYGLSLLESHRGSPVWTAELSERDGFLPQVGPYGPSFCTVQTKRELTVIDPGRGTTLWRRIELPPDGGMHCDQSAGLFGDDHLLVMLGSDGSSYTAYRTRTGEELSRGRLPITPTRARRAFGRKLFFIETQDDHSIVRVWDPATGRDDLRVPFKGTLFHTSTDADDLVLYFGENGRLLIYRPDQATASLDIRLPELPPGTENPPHSISAFTDGERFYVGLNQSDPRRFADGAKVTHYLYDTPLSAGHVQGRLFAIDRRSGDVLWCRVTDQRSFLDPSDHRAPVLVGVARVTDPRLGNRKSLLVEAVDKRSGATLAVEDGLIYDVPLQFRRTRDGLELSGMTSTAVLDFEPEARDPIACRESE